MSSSWTLGQVFATGAREHPERILLVANGRTPTYGQAQRSATALAAALAELGELWYDDRIFQLEDLLSSGEGRAAPGTEMLEEDDLALLHTPGTMGKPEGVHLSHRTVVETAVRTGEALVLQETFEAAEALRLIERDRIPTRA